MSAWQTVFGQRSFDGPTPLTVRGRQISGHVARFAHGLVERRWPTVADFPTRAVKMDGQTWQVGTLRSGGRPVADVAVWIDRYGVGCAGLLRATALTASASLVAAEPWPVWQLDDTVARLTAVELDRSTPPLIAGLAAADARERALARIATTRRDHALHRIEQARRR